MKICQQCGREFDPVNERPSHPAKYCSRGCSHAAQRTLVTLTCRQCDREFRRKAYMKDWSQERGPFCGFACYGRWQKEHMAGSANPNYVSQSNAQGAGQWERNRLAALERDGYQCVTCSSTHRLHVHHKHPWAPDQEDPHALDNLETLCVLCHRKLHPVPHGPDGRFVPIH
jgi:hypothetical protein